MSQFFGNISRERVVEAVLRHGVRNARVFGSVARGTDAEGGDLDLLVEFEPGRNLFDLIELIDELEEVSGRSVDIVTER
jgi:predicted nucleotidyltransferase